MKYKRIAIITDYLYWYGGGQKLEESLTNIFPDADFYCGFIHPKYKGWMPKNIKFTWVNKLPFKRYLAPIYELLLPIAFESLNLSEYDLVITSTQIFSKGILVNENTLHVSYIHTPPRFLYNLETSRINKIEKVFSLPVKTIKHYLRIWDFISAQRPSILITNSETTRKRIKNIYNRDAIIINPCVKISDSDLNLNRNKNTFLLVSRLVRYKNIDKVINAFKKIPEMTLYIAGDGDQRKELENTAKGYTNIKFLGYITEEKRIELCSTVEATIFLGNEDFGITSIESLSFGTPVIGLNKGGTKEILDGCPVEAGILVDNLEADTIVHAIKSVSVKKWDITKMREYTKKYSYSEFKDKIEKILNNF